MPRIRVLVVDDAVVIRRLITEALGTDPAIEVVGAAANGRIALQKISQVNPDLVTMDVEMPELNGLETVRELRRTHPKLPVIMFSTLTLRGAESTLDTLAAGATDYVTKPANVGNVTEAIERLKVELIPKIKLHCRAIAPLATTVSRAPVPTISRPVHLATAHQNVVTPKILAIGCSTGGPNALAALFADLAYRLPVPVVIVQHMPPLFTKMLAERLGKNSPNRFVEGADGDQLEAGCVSIAPGGRHMEIRSEGPRIRLHLQDDAPENSCRPAVDVLFRSVAAVYGPASLGVVLTGMGQDGLRGCQHLRERGARVLAQDEASSVVWGMPGYVAHAGLADQVLPLTQLGAEITRRLRRAA